jgi:hypothetical protein
MMATPINDYTDCVDYRAEHARLEQERRIKANSKSSGMTEEKLREALLEAIEILVKDEACNIEKGYGSVYLPAINKLRHMAKELE